MEDQSLNDRQSSERQLGSSGRNEINVEANWHRHQRTAMPPPGSISVEEVNFGIPPPEGYQPPPETREATPMQYNELVEEYANLNIDPPFNLWKDLPKPFFKCCMKKPPKNRTDELGKLLGFAEQPFRLEVGFNSRLFYTCLRGLGVPATRESIGLHVPVLTARRDTLQELLAQQYMGLTVLFLALFVICYPRRSRSIAAVFQERELSLLSIANRIAREIVVRGWTTDLRQVLLVHRTALETSFYIFSAYLVDWFSAYIGTYDVQAAFDHLYGTTQSARLCRVGATLRDEDTPAVREP